MYFKGIALLHQMGDIVTNLFVKVTKNSNSATKHREYDLIECC